MEVNIKFYFFIFIFTARRSYRCDVGRFHGVDHFVQYVQYVLGGDDDFMVFGSDVFGHSSRRQYVRTVFHPDRKRLCTNTNTEYYYTVSNINFFFFAGGAIGVVIIIP